jgi:nucleotide-binding universal stress UspA family protein
MSYKSLLVHLDTSTRTPVRLETALALARRFDAHLDGLFSVFMPQPYSFYESTGTAAWFDARRREREQQRASVERLYAAECLRADVNGNWLAADGDPNVDVPRRARCADLVVAGQTDATDPDGFIAEHFVENLVLSAGRPVLLLPYAGHFPSPGTRILVAWDGSREAARAVHDALPFIVTAQQTTVLTIDAQGADTRDSARLSGTDIALALARHRANVKVEHTVGASPGDALLSYASDLQCDLIVMGVYGHSRWRELVMGGASRTILQSMTVPVLMAH